MSLGCFSSSRERKRRRKRSRREPLGNRGRSCGLCRVSVASASQFPFGVVPPAVSPTSPVPLIREHDCVCRWLTAVRADATPGISRTHGGIRPRASRHSASAVSRRFSPGLRLPLAQAGQEGENPDGIDATGFEAHLGFEVLAFAPLVFFYARSSREVQFSGGAELHRCGTTTGRRSRMTLDRMTFDPIDRASPPVLSFLSERSGIFHG